MGWETLYTTHISELELPVPGAVLRALLGPQPLWHVPEDDVGALGLVVEQVELLLLLLHLRHLVRSQLNEALHLFLEAIRSLKLSRCVPKCCDSPQSLASCPACTDQMHYRAGQSSTF